jgi:hypothetical protein
MGMMCFYKSAALRINVVFSEIDQFASFQYLDESWAFQINLPFPRISHNKASVSFNVMQAE